MIHSTNLAGLRLSSTCSICSRVIIQKSVFKILQGYSISWLCLLELTTPSTQKFLIIGLLGSCSVLSEFSLPRIFWSILRELLCMQHIRNSTAGSLSRTTSCHAGFYIILWTSTLWISSSLAHSLIEVLLIISPSQPTLYYSEWVKLLKFWQVFSYKQTSDQYYYGTVKGYIYTAEVQRCLSLELAVQSIWESGL